MHTPKLVIIISLVSYLQSMRISWNYWIRNKHQSLCICIRILLLIALRRSWGRIIINITSHRLYHHLRHPLQSSTTPILTISPYLNCISMCSRRIRHHRPRSRSLTSWSYYRHCSPMSLTYSKLTIFSIFLSSMTGISWRKISAYIPSNVCMSLFKILTTSKEFSTSSIRNVWLSLTREFNYS